ncbi:MAG: gamma-glutamylcyclotransferase family protein [Mariprofundaceae bacterium]|nr:gamma-glutamylcyclotransferase family protein [Mariprofundaceae bacterium]
MSMLYFAYGSNMYSTRMCKRAPSAVVIGTACLHYHHVVCNKLGQDGTAKANIVPQRNAATYGVLYKISANEMELLDTEETGYRRVEKMILNHLNQKVHAQTYVAFQLTHQPVTTAWYKSLMIQGATEHGLPDHYIHVLERLPATGQTLKPDA